MDFDKDFTVMVIIVGNRGKCLLQSGYGILRKLALTDICDLNVWLFAPETHRISNQIAGDSQKDDAAEWIFRGAGIYFMIDMIV